MANFLITFANIAFDLYSFAIIARILMSWFPGAAQSLRSALRDLTEPYLVFFRNIIPRAGMIDFSPIVALLALDLVKAVVISLLTYITRL